MPSGARSLIKRKWIYNTGNEMQDFTADSVCSTRELMQALNHYSTIFPCNNYSISSRWEETRVNDARNMCSAAMLCCSCTTDPSSWYSTCHFLRAGEYSSNTGDLNERKTIRRGIITSPHTVHTHKHNVVHMYFKCLQTLRTVHTAFDSWTEPACPTT